VAGRTSRAADWFLASLTREQQRSPPVLQPRSASAARLSVKQKGLRDDVQILHIALGAREPEGDRELHGWDYSTAPFYVQWLKSYLKVLS